MGSRRPLTTVIAVLVAGVVLAGCGGGKPGLTAADAATPGAADGTATQVDVSAGPSASSAPTATPALSPTNSAKKAAKKAKAGSTTSQKKKAKSSSSKTSQGALRTGTTSACGGGRSSAWASWPMPNPRGLGLPNGAAYTDLGNGSVKDKVTCLVWQKAYSPQKLTWSAAKSYCSSLNIGGGGWRLPSRVELTSIFDFTRSGPAIDTSVFKGIANFFWTGSPWAVPHTPKYAWAMNFYEGLTTNAGNTQGAYFARCVKASTGSGAATYKAVSSGERQDSQTGLIWQRASSKQEMSASAAKSYCAGLSLAGHSWRLPSIKELATTVDESRVAPAINRTAFPDTAKSSYYWSSSKSAAKPSQTWGLNYDDGFTSYYSLSSAYVRCVR